MSNNRLDHLLNESNARAETAKIKEVFDNNPELRRTKFQNKIPTVISDLEKYEKIAANKHAQNLKNEAWNALIAEYPEVENVPKFDVPSFLNTFGIELIYEDPHSGLFFVRNGYFSNQKMSWSEVNNFIITFRYAGLRCRLPSEHELTMLFIGIERLDWFNASGLENVKQSDFWYDPAPSTLSLSGMVTSGAVDIMNNLKDKKYVIPVCIGYVPVSRETKIIESSTMSNLNSHPYNNKINEKVISTSKSRPEPTNPLWAIPFFLLAMFFLYLFLNNLTHR